MDNNINYYIIIINEVRLINQEMLQKVRKNYVIYFNQNFTKINVTWMGMIFKTK